VFYRLRTVPHQFGGAASGSVDRRDHGRGFEGFGIAD
jgi:hypothetical protein